MSEKSEEQKTLRDMLAEMSQYCRKIEKIRNEIDKRYGVGLYMSSIPGWQCSAEIKRPPQSWAYAVRRVKCE